MEKIIVIKPGIRNEAEIVEVEKLDLDTMQSLVEGYIEMITLEVRNWGHFIDLWVNEDGRSKGLPLNFLLSDYVSEIRGTAFVCGRKKGASIGLTDEEAAEWVKEINSWPKAIF
jgi:hypothetical protein